MYNQCSLSAQYTALTIICLLTVSLVLVLVCVHVHCSTSVLAAAGFLVALMVDARLGAFSPTSSSECSVLASDWSELCWDDASSARDVAAKERAAKLNEIGGHSMTEELRFQTESGRKKKESPNDSSVS